MRLAALLWMLLAMFAAHAQTFPVAGKPVRIVVPFAPGGSTIIGARDVQKAAPDGHTLLCTIATHVQIPHLYREPPWDPFRDFTPMFNTVQELVAYARAHPGKLNYASFGATAAESRKAALPDLPTLREAGFDVGMWGYLWFWGPGGMAPATVESVYQLLAKAIHPPNVKELWGQVIRSVGVKLD